jgi:hypothetical protein
MDQERLILKNMVRFHRMISMETSAGRLSRLRKLLAQERDKLFAFRKGRVSAPGGEPAQPGRLEKKKVTSGRLPPHPDPPG